MKLFLSTHGAMASGMLSSIQLLCGQTDNITVFDAYLDPDISVESQIEEFLQNCSDDEVKLLISDIPGGSVNNDMTPYANRKNMYVVTGVNLPLLLELVAHEEDLSEGQLDDIIEKSRMMTKRVALPTKDFADTDLFD